MWVPAVEAERLEAGVRVPAQTPGEPHGETPWCSGSGTRARRSRGSGSCFGTRDEPNRGLILITTTEFYKTSEGSLAAFPPAVLTSNGSHKEYRPPCYPAR